MSGWPVGWLGLALLSACDITADCKCLQILLRHDVEVIDQAGRPAVGLSTRTVHAESGFVIHEGRPGHAPGFYNVIQSGDGPADEDGELVRFEVMSFPNVYTADFMAFGSSCCGFSRATGPEQIVIMTDSSSSFASE